MTEETQAELATNETTEKADPFAELEAERVPASSKQEDTIEKKEEAKPEKKEAEPVEKREPEKKTTVEEKEDEEDEEIVSLKQENEKTKKSLLESQKWGTKNSQKVKTALKKVAALLESGSFTSEEEEQLSSLRDVLHLDIEPESQQEESPKSSHPIEKFVSLARPKLEIMRELAEDQEAFDKGLNSFDYMILDCKPEELDILLNELDDIKDEPIKVAKKIVQLGSENYDNFYKDYHEHGGYRNTIKNKNKEIKKLKDQIDKLSKKLLNNNGFTENPVYGVHDDGAPSKSDEKPKDSDDPFASMESERSQEVRQRRR